MKLQLTREEFLVRMISIYALLHQLNSGSRSGEYVRQVGLRLAQWIDEQYKKELGVTRLTPPQYAELLVDLKRSIGGDFYPLEVSDARVVLASRSCPFGRWVQDAPNLCNMTASVFGGIAARNFGYSKVVMQQRLAVGHINCHVTIHLRPTPQAEASPGIAFQEEDLPGDYVDGTFGLRWERHHLEDCHAARPHSLVFDLPELRDQVLNETGVGLMVADTDGTPVMLNPLAERWCAQGRGTVLLHGMMSLAAQAGRGGSPGGSEGPGGGVNAGGICTPDGPGGLSGAGSAGGGAGADRPATGEVEVRSERGTRHYHLRAVRLNSGFGPTSVLVIIRDVTEQKVLTERLVQSERLRMLGELAAGAAHDLRNPLAVVRSLLQLVVRKGGTLTESVAATMLSEIDRAAKVIEQYLAVARVPAPSLARVELAPLLSQAAHLMAAHCAAGRIDLRVQPTSLTVVGDRGQLLRVLLNLASNAVDAMPQGGTLTFRAEVDGDQIRLSVEDTGQGLAPEHLARLYDPFFTTKAKGTGLGLYISRYLIEQMGGRIRCRSQLGTGTTFDLFLPAGEVIPVAEDSGR